MKTTKYYAVNWDEQTVIDDGGHNTKSGWWGKYESWMPTFSLTSGPFLNQYRFRNFRVVERTHD